MMKKLVLVMSLLVVGISMAWSATLTGQRKQDVISKINAATSKVTSMASDFTQTKYLSLLSDKMVSQGKMYYRQSDKLRWEYTTPYKYLFIFNGAKVYVANKSKKDVIDTKSNKVFKEVARIMMSTVTGKALSNTTDFSVDVSETTSSWNVTLTPRKKELRQMFAKVELVFSRNASVITELNIYEKNNDRTNIRFKNTTVNKGVRETLFAIPK